MAEKCKVQRKMQTCLDRLGLPLKAAWTPNGNHDKHGLIEPESKTLFIFDENEEEAWATFTHEIFEWKLRSTLSLYQETINSLIEIIQKTCYKRKEEFLEAIPNVLKLIEEERNIEQE